MRRVLPTVLRCQNKSRRSCCTRWALHPMFYFISFPHTQVTEAHREALHKINSRKFHYFQKGTFPPFFVKTLLLFHLSSKIIALVLVILVFLNHLNKYFNEKLSALVLVVLQVGVPIFYVLKFGSRSF